MRIYLRIADELYLKRLIVGGYEAVYELAKDFRNEGIDRTHYPEFTQLELYKAYADYNDMMEIFEEMLDRVAMDVFGTHKFTYQGKSFSLKPPFRRLTIEEGLRQEPGLELSKVSDEELAKVCLERGFEEEGKPGRGKLIEFLVERFIEPKIVEPTFLMDYPREVSPLAKPKEDNPEFVERFEPFCCGLELGNAFTELNDPVVQRENFALQEELRAKGDDEAQVIDEDFLQALEYGMPPTGGLGIGIDRVVMLLTDNPSIREVILFPQLREKP